MKNTILGAALAGLALLLTAPAMAQSQMEVGGLGAISTYSSLGVSNNGGASGDVGPGLGFQGGFVLGQMMSGRWGGEFRYLYFNNELELDTGGATASLGAESHSIGYDVLYYFSDLDAKIRPYVAAGVGMKYFRGRGAEDPFQPGSDLAILTKTNQSVIAGDFGFGVKIRVTENAIFRVEFRDYISPVPKNLITPAPGATFGGDILNHWVPLIGLSWTF